MLIVDVIPCFRYRFPLVLYSLKGFSLLGTLSPFRVPAMGGLGAILAWAWGEQSNERAELGYGHFVTADYLSLLHMLTNSGKAVNVIPILNSPLGSPHYMYPYISD